MKRGPIWSGPIWSGPIWRGPQRLMTCPGNRRPILCVLQSMRYEIVVIGTSMGGLQALEVLLEGLPATFPLPVVIVQHRSAGASAYDRLRVVLQRHSSLKLLEPQDKEQIQPERAYLAPPDYHLMVEEGAFALSTEAPVWSA